MQEDDLPDGDPRRGANNQRPKHTLTVKELFQEHAEAKSKKIPRTVRVPLSGFKIKRHRVFEWRGSGAKGELMVRRRNPEIFLELCPTEVIDKMLENLEQTRVEGAHLITSTDVSQYFALRTFIYGKHKSSLSDTFTLLREKFGDQSMAHGRWERISEAWVCSEAVKLPNKASQDVFINSEVITIGDKLKYDRGESPYKSYVPNKDPPNGH